MKKIILILLFILSLGVSAQVISSSRWSDLFSYNNVLAIREDNGKLIAATENGIFFYTPSSGEITKLSKANGLHEVKISAFDYNPETQIGLVGYKNGSMDLITPEGITYIVDIPIATGYTGDKKINHISITGNLAVISVGYGVSIFRLDRKEFGDSSFFVTSGVYEAAKEAVIKENKVYAVTATGVKSHEMNVTFPIYNTWEVVASGNFSHIAVGNVMAFSSNTAVYYGNGTFNTIPRTFWNVQDVVVTPQNIIITDLQEVWVYNLSGNLVKTFSTSGTFNTAILSNTKVYSGSKNEGIIDEAGNSIKPDGPYSNTSYKMDLYQNQIVISTGGRIDYNAPILSRYLGYYHFDGAKWNYPEYFKTFPVPLNVLDAVINPAKPSEIFFVNGTPIDGQKGIYKMENNQFVKNYLSTDNHYNNIAGMTFDENNQLFAPVAYIPGSNKMGFYYYNPSSDSFGLVDVLTAGSTQKPLVKSGILYIPSPTFSGGGLLMYDYRNTPSSTADDRFKILRKSNNLPADGVVSVAIDKNDDVWMGTRLGLRILQNPSAAIDEADPQTEPIIIEENNVGEELFRDNHILQIAVDTGNQKWISVDDGGVFYLSSTGEQTIKHFTKANSPLPTNGVTDIKIDNNTGKIYFATVDGVVVYQGDVLDITENFGAVLVYPNPVVYSNYKGNVRIRGLAEKTNIRITDAAGNLVHQAVARGGYYEWNLNNHRGVRVASGIYFVLMTNADGTDTATAKIAVVN